MYIGYCCDDQDTQEELGIEPTVLCMLDTVLLDEQAPLEESVE